MAGTCRYRFARRGVVAGLLALLGVALLAGPAAAHVEVSADNAQAFAEDVVPTHPRCLSVTVVA